MPDEIQNALELSDDDFLKMTPPTGTDVPVVEAPAQEVETEADKAIAANGDTAVEEEVKPEEPPVVTDPAAEPVKKEEPAPAVPGSEAKPAEAAKPEAGKETPKPVETQTPINYQESYEKIMAPFKANGKTIELKSPDEAIKLMQMGANYTRKMQELTPNLKFVQMLQNNNLLDVDKLSFLIDLEKKNPDAIKKLVKDSGIDPLDINTAEPTSYQPGNHQVSDEQTRFDAKLDDFKSTEAGMQTLQIVHSTWDDTSKAALFTNPELLDVFQTQRENGVYDQIVTELERQRTLGQVPRNIPFLQAYKQVGDYMVEHALFKPVEAPVTTPKVLGTRVAPTAKTDAAEDARVKAAAPIKENGGKKADAVINPLSMSDEDFLKTMQGRL